MKNMTKLLCTSAVVCAWAGSAWADGHGATRLPDPPALDQRSPVELIAYDDVQSFGRLDSLNQPDWVAALEAEGVLPPLTERVPAEPLIFNTTIMPDGAGEYGGVFRHVIGGRPQGWNWAAGLHQGWGGVNYTVQECLTRTGPMYALDDSRVEPLPNLAKSWEWSEDGKSLTMHLVEGARWSDGDPFDAEDIMFHWTHMIQDPDVPAVLSSGSLGDGTTLDKVDDYTVKFTFQTERPILNLYSMAYRNLCPGPSHILEPLHPTNSGSSYDEFINALAPENLPWVSMGAWVPTRYQPDEIIVMRRDPYYWKFDSEGNQLPYIDEMHFKLSTWQDRTVQALAGSGDFSNMQSPSIYLEALQRSRQPDFPARLAFGPRTYTWSLDVNFAKTIGVASERDMAVRDLNRNLTFRKALSHAVDREALGQGLVRGPFTAPHAGGLAPETAWFDIETVSYFGYDPERSKALLAEIGFVDTDGNGVVNWPDGPEAGKDLEVSLLYAANEDVIPVLADGLISMMSEVGIRVVASPSTDDTIVSIDNADWDWNVRRTAAEMSAPVSDFGRLAVTGPKRVQWHYATPDAPQILEPFEEELVVLIDRFRTAPNAAEQVEIMRDYNRIYTKNLYTVGLLSAPGALIIHKRIKNLRDGVPILAYQWAEDAVIRELFWVAEGDRIGGEIAPNTVPQY